MTTLLNAVSGNQQFFFQETCKIYGETILYVFIHCKEKYILLIIVALLLIQVISTVSLVSDGFLPKDGSGRVIAIQHLPDLESVCVATDKGDVILWNTVTDQARSCYIIIKKCCIVYKLFIFNKRLSARLTEVSSYNHLSSPVVLHVFWSVV